MLEHDDDLTQELTLVLQSASRCVDILRQKGECPADVLYAINTVASRFDINRENIYDC